MNARDQQTGWHRDNTTSAPAADRAPAAPRQGRRTDAVNGTTRPPGGSDPCSEAGRACPASRRGAMPDSPWPRCSVLELGALPTAVPCARLHARQVLWEWRLGGLREVAELVVSELVTNAVQATAGRQLPAPVRLRLSSDGSRALVEVWDADSRPPQPRAVEADGVPDLVAERGRGLLLVAALSTRWGWYPERRCGGKVVWAELLNAAPAASGDLAARFMSLVPAWAQTSQLSRVRRARNRARRALMPAGERSTRDVRRPYR
jgi:anti-sigma regulatory factor (Ser/Thr protein kinase)